MSMNTHLGNETSRRDDLEALGYTMLFLLEGSLPWMSIKGDPVVMNEPIKDSKEEFYRNLRNNFPEEFYKFMYHCVDQVQFYDKPDYGYLRSLLENLLIFFTPGTHA